MFNANLVIPEFENLIGWKQHSSTSEFQIEESLTETQSGEYYQQKHSALRLDIIRASLSDNIELSDYLKEKIQFASTEMLNDLLTIRQISGYGKTLLDDAVLLNKMGWANDKITNESRFVGFEIKVNGSIGLKALIKQIGLQFSGEESFTLYLFHSNVAEPISEIDVTTDSGGQWTWNDAFLDLYTFSEKYKGGVFYLGYYQDDITTNAINNTDFDFDKGACLPCTGGPGYQTWKSITNYYTVYPFYVPAGDYTVGQMFDLEHINYVPKVTYGLNLSLGVYCDLTRFFITNKMVFKNLLALKVAYMILNDIRYSPEINYIEENVKMMIIRDLEGDVDTKKDNITTQYHKELKAVKYNISAINEKCLPCENVNSSVSYDVV